MNALMECQPQQQIATVVAWWWKQAANFVDLFVLPARLLGPFSKDKYEFSNKSATAPTLKLKPCFLWLW